MLGLSDKSPSDEEVRRYSNVDIEPADMWAATDPEESAASAWEDGYTVIIAAYPHRQGGGARGVYIDHPAGAFWADRAVGCYGLTGRQLPSSGDFPLPAASRASSTASENAVRPLQIALRAAMLCRCESRASPTAVSYRR